MTGPPPRYAAFVSPHGYGHAARASAVLGAVHALSGARFEIYSTVPRWFFEESLAGLIELHEVACDVGFRQASALHADLPATVAALDDFLPLDDALVDRLAEQLRETGCRAVLVDISPLGIAVAERAGLPSLQVESFDWARLYRSYLEEEPGLARHIDALAELRLRAYVTVQTEPRCFVDSGLACLDPISRPARRSREETRADFDVPNRNRMVVVTMGGYEESMPFLEDLHAHAGTTFVITGAARTGADGNLRLLNNRTAVFMPDLMRAADAVVAKLGYGTVAEVWREGTPYGFVSRPGFPEMPPLETFALAELPALEISQADFVSGGWTRALPELLALPRRPREGNGADAAAELLLGL